MTSSLAEILRRRAERQHGERLYTFLDEGGRDQSALTYGQLDVRARAIAAHLESSGLRGKAALLLYPASGQAFLEAFFACLYAGVIAVPLSPPGRLTRALPRLLTVASDAEASAVLTAGALGDLDRAIHEQAPALASLT